MWTFIAKIVSHRERKDSKSGHENMLQVVFVNFENYLYKQMTMGIIFLNNLCMNDLMIRKTVPAGSVIIILINFVRFTLCFSHKAVKRRK